MYEPVINQRQDVPNFNSVRETTDGSPERGHKQILFDTGRALMQNTNSVCLCGNVAQQVRTLRKIPCHGSWTSKQFCKQQKKFKKRIRSGHSEQTRHFWLFCFVTATKLKV